MSYILHRFLNKLNVSSLFRAPFRDFSAIEKKWPIIDYTKQAEAHSKPRNEIKVLRNKSLLI